jgi:hypothetical protein
MALVLKDRVKETTTTTSTGTYTLAGAVTGFQAFSVVGDGNTTYYTVTDGTNWEVGIGTYTLSGTTLSRDTILESSNSGSAVNWGAGSKDVFLTYPAEQAVNNNSTTTNALAIGLGNGGVAPVANNDGSIAIGSAYSSGVDSFAAVNGDVSGVYGALGDNAVAIGSSAKADQDSVGIGSAAQATGIYSLALGFNAKATVDKSVAILQSISDIEGKLTFAGNFFSPFLGSAQCGIYFFLRQTTDATPAVLTTDNSSPSTDNQIVLSADGLSFSFHGTIIARQQLSGGTNYAAWEIKGSILRNTGAASTTLGSHNVNRLSASAGASAWTVVLSADTTNAALKIEATGAAATNIRWGATVTTSEIFYG